MGFKHSEFTKQEAIRLRKQGRSYNEIRKALDIKSKGTLSIWFKNLKLSSLEKRRLAKNMFFAQKQGLLDFNHRRTARILRENKEALEAAANSITKLSQHELLLVGTALYWGEGTKSESGRKNTVSFSNSDPQMIKLFMRFLREALNLPDEWIRGGIHIYPHIKELEARKFWGKITKIPPDRFYIVNQVSSASRGKRPQNALPFGTAVIRVNKRLIFHKIKGYIKALAAQADIN